MSDVATARSRATVISTAVGVVAGLFAVAFVVRALLRDRDTISDALAVASLGWIGVGLLLAAVAMVAIAVPWHAVLVVLGGRMAMSQVVARYFVGELGKYIPGGVWPVLGRGELARKTGIPRPVAYGSVMLSLVTLYLAAMFVVVVGLPTLIGGDGAEWSIALVLLPLGVAALHPKVLRTVVGLVARVMRRPVDVRIPSWGTAVLLVARYVPAWLAIGGATWAVARSLDPSAGVFDVGTAAVLSWIVGFVVVPVPGGVGVREAAFVAAAGSLDPGVAAVVAVVIRVLFVVVDAIGASVGSMLLRQPVTEPTT
ncbi:MAG: lysylphosphatidylglycerol synthase domain-containing protein [Acidimicrobiales bacterium]